jgi:N-formylglutamate deformylase
VKLPLLISVPHGGLLVPSEIRDQFLLSTEQVMEDGDKEAREIYDVEDLCQVCVQCDTPRAVVDLNRAEDDLRADGVVKTHTIFEEPVYREPLTSSHIEELLARYYRPYHRRLSEAIVGMKLGIDCHTMLADSPPISPHPGVRRPRICLSNADGATCPDDLFQSLSQALEASFDVPVSQNDPFKGGYIIRAHAAEMPWVQLEISREPFVEVAEKRACLRQALREFGRNLR